MPCFGGRMGLFLIYVFKHEKEFAHIFKMFYLCICYPEYNLFTLKRLIPIEMNALLCEKGGVSRFPHSPVCSFVNACRSLPPPQKYSNQNGK